MKGSIWAVVVVAVVITVAFLAIPAATEESAETRYANETHTITSTSSTTLDNASEWYRMVENETVENSATGTEYDRGDDYTIDYENGTLKAVQGSAADGAEVHVLYYWQELDDTTSLVVALLSWGGVVVPYLFLAVTIGAVFAMVGRS